MLRVIRFALLFLLCSVAAQAQSYTWKDTLDAIRQVETGGLPNEGLGAKGDNGNALGPYQIWKVYHIDAATVDRSLTRYQTCLNCKQYSERVVTAYMRRYARASLDRLQAGRGKLSDVEFVARIHNGGPRANRASRRKATDRYWQKVRKAVQS